MSTERIGRSLFGLAVFGYGFYVIVKAIGWELDKTCAVIVGIILMKWGHEWLIGKEK